MAEVTTTVASAAALGMSAAALGSIGLEPGQLGMSFMACLFGAGMAPEMSRARHVLAFAAAVVCSAVLGKFVALRWMDSSALTAAVCAIGIGIFFHPLVALAGSSLPQLRDWLMRSKGSGQ